MEFKLISLNATASCICMIHTIQTLMQIMLIRMIPWVHQILMEDG